MRLAHVGFSVEDIDSAVELWNALGFTVKKRFEKPEPKAHVASLVDEAGGGLELWQFTEEHPLNDYIGKHAAFICADARADAEKLAEAGFAEVIPYTEGVVLNYIFMQDKFGTCYELAEEKR